jgi:hypothetical protein
MITKRKAVEQPNISRPLIAMHPNDTPGWPQQQSEEADQDDRGIREVHIEGLRDCRVQTSYYRGQFEENEGMQRKQAN